jgi:hypothetical protein
VKQSKEISDEHLIAKLSEEINTRGYSEKTLSAYLAANDHLIRYFRDEACNLFNTGLHGIKSMPHKH